MERGYPEWGLRERILWRVQELCKDRQEGADRMVRREDIAKTPEEVDEFRVLVDKGYIRAGEPQGAAKTEPFSHVVVHSLGTPGKRAIEELPDPKDEFLRRLDAIKEAIWALQDPNVSDEQKGGCKSDRGSAPVWYRSIC